MLVFVFAYCCSTLSDDSVFADIFCDFLDLEGECSHCVAALMCVQVVVPVDL